MIVVRLPMSSSFRQRIEYLYRGSTERALFDATQHLVSPARKAIPEMEDTAASQSHLKLAAGIRRGGRKCVNPVTHDVISWAADELPELGEMERAARSYLAAIGIADHQAVIVGHDHNGKRHVHIVANRIHPITGKVADRTDDQVKAQAWAHAYEVAQGRIRCRHREAPKIDRAFALAANSKAKSGQRPSRTAFETQRKRKAADAETRKRHRAEAWSRLMVEQAATAANIASRPEQQSASLPPAPRP